MTPPRTARAADRPARGRSRAQIAQRLQRAAGALSTDAVARMEREMPWVTQLSAQERSWIGLIVQAGIKAFVDWYREPDKNPTLRAEVFGAAPQTFAGVISLQQTVELVRLSIEVVEESVVEVVGKADADRVLRAIDSYAREVAFAAAEVYARQAEQRGAWDARLEALVVDGLLRGGTEEDIASRASALGWNAAGRIVVVVGRLTETGIDAARRIAHDRGLDCLCGVQGDLLLVILGGVDELGHPAERFAGAFADGPVVIGPAVTDLTAAGSSAQIALTSLRAARAWVAAPRPVHADDLLPERALDGDVTARSQLQSEVYGALAAAGDVLLDTAQAYLDHGSSIEATGRALFVHPNTIRYRLRRIREVTGFSPTDPRESYTLRVALTLGRLSSGDL
ncbi:MAG TPA: helix-turn-helix domain-containing protein [Marmoricola sp.]|nr:helix-turn-helix domain-containing protein [Marmoricola sp.]